MSLNMTAIVWDELVDIPSNKEPELSYNFTTDPLLISCTLHRLIKEAKADNKFTYNNWSLVEHMDKIAALTTDEDKIFAEAVGSYYKSKLIMAKLRNDHFTKYKSDLLQYLNDSPMSITSKFVGMVYKLPCFYEYDMKLIEIFDGEYSSVSNKFADKTEILLSFISKADNGQKRSRHYEYWFKDDKGVRVLVEVEKHNPVRNLWEHTIQNGKLVISGSFEKKRRDNLEFYTAKGWSVNV